MKLAILKEKVLAHLTKEQVREFGILTRKETWQAALDSLSESIALEADKVAELGSTPEMGQAGIDRAQAQIEAEEGPEPVSPVFVGLLLLFAAGWLITKVGTAIGTAVIVIGACGWRYAKTYPHRANVRAAALALQAD